MPLGQACVDDRALLIDPAPERRDDAVHHKAQLLFGLERLAALIEHALALEEDRAGAVDHDLRDGRVAQQALERAKPQHHVERLRDNRVHIAGGQRGKVTCLEYLLDCSRELDAGAVAPRSQKLRDLFRGDLLVQRISKLYARGIGIACLHLLARAGGRSLEVVRELHRMRPFRSSTCGTTYRRPMRGMISSIS